MLYQTPDWPPGGTTAVVVLERLATPPIASPRLGTRRPFAQTLWTLGVILAIGVPCAIGWRSAGGYFLAGRMLAPVGAMAETARQDSRRSH